MAIEVLRKRLINLRESENLSQVELGRRIGINNTIINKIESGTRGVSAEELGKFAEFYGVTTDYLLGNNNTPVWATKQDVIDLQDVLDDKDGTSFNFGGQKLTNDQNAKLNLALTQIFWDKLKERKQSDK
ncbi:helix-turn-helix domain-containing protein [Lacticaseibacillus porcinae]|uniref:helix-turn-helix domain-containing protein n=1 Tax=Lacticaseibacillus porcinae TaxID=1123687 RepID=UPI001CDD26F6|nr:helix-turn-helix transcriptional regulator [Lacticaseibacillus porcinae]